jgi:hypothetical protein
MEVRPMSADLLALKSHQTFGEVQLTHPSGPVIYMVRDGRDSLLSYYFYTQAFIRQQEKEVLKLGSQKVLSARSRGAVSFDADDFSEFLEQQAPRWGEHVTGWHNRPGVLTLNYEQLLADFPAALTQVAAYLDEKPVVSVDEVYRAHVVELRQHFQGEAGAFHRTGKSGDWKNYFTARHEKIFASATKGVPISPPGTAKESSTCAESP